MYKKNIFIYSPEIYYDHIIIITFIRIKCIVVKKYLQNTYKNNIYRILNKYVNM